MNSFRECFPKNHIPEMAELEAFWGSDISELFRGFAEYLQEHFDLRFGIPVWSEKNGWTYRVGRSGVYLITGIIIDQDAFLVGEIKVKDRKSYRLLLEYVDSLYAENGETLVRKIAKKNIRQAERNKRRIEREREEKAALRDRIVPQKYNVFHWPEKLKPQKLRRLYLLDAKGIQDTELADEIGLTLYLRCKYGKEDMERMERYAIRCHHCQAELSGDDDFRECRCGYQYSYREYRRSYRRNNMPTGAAAKVFEVFLRDWSAAEGYPQKMFLIDSLLHEFHLSLISGVAHRPVAMNFLDGTLEKVTELINSLARE